MHIKMLLKGKGKKCYLGQFDLRLNLKLTQQTLLKPLK
uniref:Macaca fascicularis brain cDNA, clone: QmoA-11202 n=1 Tax=Macaca fascicularis TaxID=9541 RepID=I7GJ36_MACFA|nr:unnamed protein product [Macaca fascicularis]